MSLKNFLKFTSILFLSLTFTACQKSENNHSTDTNTSQQVLTIGFQKSQIGSLVARQQKFLEQEFPNTKIEWKEFPAGPQMLEALSAGSVDIGSVGNIPPIFAQAGNKTITYIAYEPVPAKALALIVPQDSKIKSIEDLKGKKIALQKGSAAHDLLNKILAKAGLNWKDISPIWLPPAEAKAAFTKKSVDAWVSWDPYLSLTERDTNVRTVIDDSSFPAAYQFYIANPDYLKAHPDAVNKFILASNQANVWIKNHPKESLDYYAKTIGLETDIAQKYLDKRSKDLRVSPIDEVVIKSQQDIADNFYNEKLIPIKIDIKKTVWTNN